jgi:AraC-like DNA-binding protein
MSEETPKQPPPQPPAPPPAPVSTVPVLSTANPTPPAPQITPGAIPETIVRVPMGRLSAIEITNYRAYRGTFRLDLPNGENLLVYGENGAGKSSFFHTLRVFLEAPDWRVTDAGTGKSRPVVVTDHRHRFTTNAPGVKLEFGARVFEWTEAKNDTPNDIVRLLNQGKGFLDYKALLAVHYIPLDDGAEIDLFPLLIRRLLPYYTYPNRGQNLQFQRGWQRLQALVKERWYRDTARKRFDEDLAAFNDSLERTAQELGRRASTLLGRFGDEFKVEFHYEKAKLTYGPKGVIAPRILARPAFRKEQILDYDRFFNEARLTALATCLFFAALKESPASGLRLLVLDDILIGLDMANRLVVLGLIDELFKDWQVIILTYHKAWFEILKARTENAKWLHGWKNVTLRLRRSLGVECPIVALESGPLLAQSRAHLTEYGDAKAAAVYARSAWEAMMSWYCEEWHLPVTYAESRRDLDTDSFLRSITRHLDTLRNPRDREWAHGVRQEVWNARRFVLNPNAHYNPELEDEIGAEIADGIRAVEEFEVLLRCVRKSDFAGPDEETEQASVGEMLQTAIEHLGATRHAAAVDTLGRAFHQHLDELFRVREETVPYGMKITRKFLFDWAGRRRLFAGLTWTRLRHSESYLLGTVKPQEMLPAAFESAVRLFLRLRIDFLIKRREHDLRQPPP